MHSESMRELQGRPYSLALLPALRVKRLGEQRREQISLAAQGEFRLFLDGGGTQVFPERLRIPWCSRSRLSRPFITLRKLPSQ